MEAAAEDKDAGGGEKTKGREEIGRRQKAGVCLWRCCPARDGADGGDQHQDPWPPRQKAAAGPAAKSRRKCRSRNKCRGATDEDDFYSASDRGCDRRWR